MADDRTMEKRKALSIAGASLGALVVLLVAGLALDASSTVGGLVQLATVIALLVFLLAGGNAGWMYWRDWYRR